MNKLPTLPHRRLVAMLTMLLGSGGILLVFRHDLSQFLKISYSAIFVTGLIFLAYGLGLLMVLYLRGTIKLRFLESAFVNPEEEEKTSRNSPLHRKINAMEEELFDLRTIIASQPSGGRQGVAVDADEVVSRLRETIPTLLTRELENRLKEDLRKSDHLAQVRDAVDTNSQRLTAEISALFRRSNLNLVIGVLTTVAAAALLYWTTIRAAPKFTDLTEILSYYVPRITTVVFIEVFAFFFLRLYKTSLTQAQHYQHELTRLAVVEVLVESAMRTRDDAILNTVLIEIARKQLRPAVLTDAKRDSKIDAESVKELAELVKIIRE